MTNLHPHQQQIMVIVDEAFSVPAWVVHERMLLQVMIRDLNVDPCEPLAVEERKQIQHGPQRNTRKGKQKRW